MSGLTQRYISKELVHFVGRGTSQSDAFDLLVKIMDEGWITHSPHDPRINGNLIVNRGATISNNDMYAPQMTCFADIPTEDLSLHMDKYSCIGLSLSKDFIARAGGVPVHYIAKNAKVERSKMDLNERMKDLSEDEQMKLSKKFDELEMFPEQYFDEMRKELNEEISMGQYFDEMLKEHHELFKIFNKLAPNLSERVRELEWFFDFHIFSYLKFFDHLKPDDDPDNYYFEREWRVAGNVNFSLSDIETVYFPSQYSAKFRGKFPSYLGQVKFTG